MPFRNSLETIHGTRSAVRTARDLLRDEDTIDQTMTGPSSHCFQSGLETKSVKAIAIALSSARGTPYS